MSGTVNNLLSSISILKNKMLSNHLILRIHMMIRGALFVFNAGPCYRLWQRGDDHRSIASKLSGPAEYRSVAALAYFAHSLP